MRIPFPNRIHPWHAGIFAGIICAIQLIEGTPIYWAFGIFIYIMTATFAFNLVGGMYRASGAYIVANAILAVILGQCAKILLREPAQSNLRDPETTILVYVAGMGVILFAALISRRLILKVPLLERGTTSTNMRQIGMGCAVLAIILYEFGDLLGTENGSVGSALRQFNMWLPLAIILIVYQTIKESGGRRSITPVSLGLILYATYIGVLGASKQGIFTGPVAYLVVCIAMRFRFRLIHMLVLLPIAAVLVFYMVPYSQVVRNYVRYAKTTEEARTIAWQWLSHPQDLLSAYSEIKSADSDAIGTIHYFDNSEGFMDRLTMVAVDDALIDITDRGNVFGFWPTLFGLENVVPHFVWKDKPTIGFGNIYAHDLDILSDEDTTTGISFSAMADAYHQGKWLGILILYPFLLIILFSAADSLTGDIRISPWGFAYTVYFLHIGPEGDCGSLIYSAFYTSFILITTVYTARFAMPVIGAFLAPEKRSVLLTRKPQSIPRSAGFSTVSRFRSGTSE